MHKLLTALLLAATLAHADSPLTFTRPPARKTHQPQMSYLENRDIRLGIDLSVGGAITYLAPATNHDLNVINSYDWGRQVQLSYYSGPVPYNPPGTTMNKAWTHIGWNPIQTGDCYGYKSQVLATTNTGTQLYVKLIPMHWPLQDVPGECECEVWLELDGPVVKARCRLTNMRDNDMKQYPARGQELPAVYVNGPFYHLMTYRGNQPFTGGALTEIKAHLESGHWGHWLATENWAAEVNDAGWGLGVWNPDTYDISGGFAGRTGAGTTLDSPTGYIAPNRDEILDHNIVYDYHYELILGTLEQIRAHVYSVAARPGPLHWSFEHDRQGWYYNTNASDTGWPLAGQLDVSLNHPQAQLISPRFFLPAAAGPCLMLEAAFSGGITNAVVSWRQMDEKTSGRGAQQAFAVIPDGQFHRYSINLAASSAYTNCITQLRLEPLAATLPARVQLKSASLGPNPAN